MGSLVHSTNTEEALPEDSSREDSPVSMVSISLFSKSVDSTNCGSKKR
jgi:hypothetical protein